LLIGSLALIDFLLRRLGEGGQIPSEGQNSRRSMKPEEEHYWPQPGRFPLPDWDAIDDKSLHA
jgi:hypothetical protein